MPIKKVLPYINFVIRDKSGLLIPIIGGDGLQLLFHDEYEPWMRLCFQWFSKYADGNKVTLIDIGANIGQTLLAARQSLIKMDYYGIEPNPRSLSYLIKFCNENKWDDVVLISSPCSDSTNLPLTLSFDPSSTSPGASLVSDLRSDNSSRIFCMPVSLECLLKTIIAGTEQLTFIKVDAEGHELSILSTLSCALLSELKPVIQIEVLPHVLHHQKTLLARWCHTNRYKILLIDTKSILSLRLKQLESFLIHDEYNEIYANYLLVHNDHESNSSLSQYLD